MERVNFRSKAGKVPPREGFINGEGRFVDNGRGGSFTGMGRHLVIGETPLMLCRRSFPLPFLPSVSPFLPRRRRWDRKEPKILVWGMRLPAAAVSVWVTVGGWVVADIRVNNNFAYGKVYWRNSSGTPAVVKRKQNAESTSTEDADAVDQDPENLEYSKVHLAALW